MRTVTRAWRWVTTNVIDLRKGAAIDSAGVVTALVVIAWVRGLSRPGSWLLLVIAALLLPVVWRIWRWCIEACNGEG